MADRLYPLTYLGKIKAGFRLREVWSSIIDRWVCYRMGVDGVSTSAVSMMGGKTAHKIRIQSNLNQGNISGGGGE